MEQRIPERRQRVRILTLKNFGKAALAAAVLLVVANLISEARKTKHDDYGRLFGNEVAKTDTIAPRPVQVVTEAAPPVEDHTAANPLLLEPAQREAQYLAVQQPVAAPQPDASGVAVSGDASGLIVVKGPKHLLAGGFGR
jgi:hypothetical protein